MQHCIGRGGRGLESVESCRLFQNILVMIVDGTEILNLYFFCTFSGSEDKTIRFWEIATCRCMKVIRFEEEVRFVEWGQSSSLCILAVAV